MSNRPSLESSPKSNSPPQAGKRPDALLFGTFDPESARTRAVSDALAALGWRLRTFRLDLWEGSAAKVGAFRRGGKLLALLRAARAVPRLFFGAFRRMPCDVLLVSTGGYMDLLAGWAPAKWGRALIVFDPLYGLHETIVEDRGLASPRSFTALAATAMDWLSFRLADVVLADTEGHADYFAQRYRVRRDRLLVVPVGAEEALFRPRPAAEGSGARIVEVLFYGTMIPLHGADTIVRAAARIDRPDIRVTMVGSGQTGDEAKRLARELGCPRLRFVPGVPYAELPGAIADADICLGIFGTTRKASLVVPTKVYQCLAMGKPIITGDTPAARRALRPGVNVVTTPPGDPAALADAIVALADDPERRRRIGRAARRAYESDFSTRAMADKLKILERHLP